MKELKEYINLKEQTELGGEKVFEGEEDSCLVVKLFNKFSEALAPQK